MGHCALDQVALWHDDHDSAYTSPALTEGWVSVDARMAGCALAKDILIRIYELGWIELRRFSWPQCRVYRRRDDTLLIQTASGVHDQRIDLLLLHWILIHQYARIINAAAWSTALPVPVPAEAKVQGGNVGDYNCVWGPWLCVLLLLLRLAEGEGMTIWGRKYQCWCIAQWINLFTKDLLPLLLNTAADYKSWHSPLNWTTSTDF